MLKDKPAFESHDNRLYMIFIETVTLFQIMKNTFDSMMKEESAYQEKVNEMLPCITQLNKETEDQKNKLERVMKQVNVHNCAGETFFILGTEQRCDFL